MKTPPEIIKPSTGEGLNKMQGKVNKLSFQILEKLLFVNLNWKEDNPVMTIC
jgi:hypothetical protein